MALTLLKSTDCFLNKLRRMMLFVLPIDKNYEKIVVENGKYDQTYDQMILDMARVF